VSLREQYECERMNDRDLFHGGPEGSQRPEAGVVGIPDPKDEDRIYCVGCLWCDPDFDRWANYYRRGVA
jgi:hypothetical protein